MTAFRQSLMNAVRQDRLNGTFEACQAGLNTATTLKERERVRIRCSGSTSGIRRATTIERLKFARPDTQSFADPLAAGAAGAPAGTVAGATGGRKRPAGAGVPFSARPQPGCVNATELSCEVMASK